MVKITGDKAFAAKLRNMSPAVAKNVSKALFVAGNEVEVEWALSITKGAVSGKNHTPSAPGQPPNADTHTYDRSIATAYISPLVVEVFADAQSETGFGYPAALEFGTSKMAARPSAGPALQKKRGRVLELVAQAVKAGTSGKG